MQKHRNTLVLVILLLVSLSCRFLQRESPWEPLPPTLPPTLPTNSPVPPGDTPAAPEVTPTPASLNPTGPYVLYESDHGVWISNPDGSFLTRLADAQLNGLATDLHRAVSPSGDRMALVVSNDQGLDLVEVKIPSGETKTITHLFSVTWDELTSDPVSSKAFATYAIRDYKDIAWQPGEGKLLAFIGAIDGPTADLYVYNTDSGEITRLTDGPSQAVFPNWSPDGQYLMHYGVSWRPPFGGAIGPHNHLDGVWAVRISDGEVLTMPTPKGVPITFAGWQDSTHYLTYDSDESGTACFSKNLTSVDVTNGAATPILDAGFYYHPVQSPETGALMFVGTADCPKSPGDGVFLLPAGMATPTKLMDKKAYEVSWMPESGVFNAYPEALFSADGSTRYDPPVYDKSFQPAISKKGYQAWEVIENQQGRVEVQRPGAEWRKIMDGSIEELTWDPLSGDTLLIVTEDDSLYAASYPDFTPRLMGKLEGAISQVAWLK